MSNRFGLEGRVAVVTGALGNLGPVWTEGLLEAFGAERVIDTPISEAAFVGAGGFPADFVHHRL